MKPRKGDIYLFATIVLVAVILISFSYAIKKAGNMVKITQNGEVIGEYMLSENVIIPIESSLGNNLIEIKNGQVKMVDADCPDGICVKHAPIFQSGDPIVCLPHELIVEVIARGEPEKYDGVAQ